MTKEFFRLSRPVNALAGCIAVFLSAYVAGATSWWPVFLAAFAVLLITASTNAWNDYLDIDIDRVNKPHRPLPAGTITPGSALIFSFSGSVLSLIVGAFISQQAFLIVLLSNILLYFYSWKLKCTVLLGNIAVAAIVALCFIFGGVAAGNIQPTTMLAVTVFFALLGREILKTMADYKGDLKEKCTTIATAWGKKVSATYVAVSLSLTALTMLLTYFIEKYSPLYLVIVIFILYPIFTYIILTAKKTSDEKVLERSSLIMKYCFFVWFLAVALGYGLAG
jgi:geranylgeranylglycerol-phosphate geranylgeranyltransferase